MFDVFPPSSLDNSILTSVLVGLLVVWVFQETLGWNFTGLVVPGYLASILVIEPVTGAVVLLESVVTWLAFSALSDRIPVRWPWSPLFGRDRFFGILLLSVAVRIALEGGGFAWLQRTFGLAVDTELHSMSLVVVPLAANAIWRTGFVASVTRLGVPVVVTWALLELVLLRVTNLSLSSFELTYEDLALDFVSSPRAYILLLTGAWLGSAANLRWGWDYGGIIVPGLLSVCWLEPSRLAATLFEVLVIALAMRVAVRLPGLRGANLTGGRPLVLAFCLAYGVKFALGWTLGSLWPGLDVRELFGFGYLLPTMIALRVIRAGDDFFRPILPAILTSFAGFSVGSVLGYALAVALPAPVPEPVRADAPERPDLALSLHAWTNQGEVPDAVALLSAPRLGDAVWGAGRGFGGLWVRPEGASLVLTARAGPPGTASALAALAVALDARAVLLCAPTGPECDVARRELGRVATVLHVEPGDRTSLRVSGRLSSRIGTRALADVLGPVALEPAGRAQVLVVDPAARMRAAASWSGADPVAVAPELLHDPLAPPPAIPDPGALRVLAEEVVGAWDAWRQREPWGDDALRFSAGTASELGLSLAADGDRAVLVGLGLRAVVDRRGGDAVVHVPQSAPGSRAQDAGRALHAALGAAVLVEDAPDEREDAPRIADRPSQAVLVGWLARLPPGARVVTIRALGETRDVGAELVLSNGRPVLGAEPAAYAPLRAVGEALGLEVAAYDGALERAWLADSGNVVRAAAEAASGHESHVTLFVGARARRRLRGEAGWGHLPIEAFDVRSLAGRPFGAADGSWDAVHRAARAAVEAGGRGGAVEALRRAAGGRVAALADPVLGVRWIAVERCAPVCERLVVPLSGVEAAAPPAVGDPLVAALALGAGAWVVR